MTNIFLSLGSNIGDRFSNLQKAIRYLSESTTILKESSIYETAPVGAIKQNNFYNMMIEVKTYFSADELLLQCLGIEKKIGRIREKKWGPRLIDIDIITFGQEEVNRNGLSIPHPEFANRRFVLEPFAEIAADFLILNHSVSDYLQSCTDSSQIKKLQSEPISNTVSFATKRTHG